jgi:hypothetical protein
MLTKGNIAVTILLACMKKFSRKSFVLLICVSLILDWNVVLAVSIAILSADGK